MSNITTYVAYANSLEQGGSAPAGALNEGQSVAPYRSKQLEAGAKVNFGKVNGTFAIFQIERPFAFADTDNIFRVQGMQENKGIEFGLYGEIFRNFNVYGGLTLLDPRLKDTGNPATSNTKVVGVPGAQANLLMEYFVERFPGLAFNANVHYTGERAGNNINTFMVKNYITLDLGMRYTMTLPDKNTAVFRVFANNVTDERYWLSIFPGSINGVPGSNTAFLGAPREVRVSASVTF
ncbi:TonB-dependent receptor domain-containing protein [Nitrobacter winogradskyi]|nr:TonB-dependent receptor [Nitrobacter winogradskyi]